MAEISNELSWSVTRFKTFQSCRRSYYYTYYGSWEGWKEEAPPLVRKAYILKKLKNLDLLAGEVVHEVIEAILTQLSRGILITPEGAKEKARDLLNRSWQESKREKWKESPARFTNLFEHYYGHPVSKERVSGIREKVFQSLDSFLSSSTFGAIRESEPKDWLALEKMDHFFLEGYKIYSKPDFAMRDGSLFYLFDWKTGKEEKEHLTQLACYALFAVHSWNADPGQIRVVPFYLRNGRAEEVRLSGENLEGTRKFILTSIQEMEALLSHRERNLASAENFPRIEKSKRCHFCPFRQICPPEILENHEPEGTGRG